MVKRILKSKIMPWISLLVGILATFFILAVIVIHTDFFAIFSGSIFSKYLFSGTQFSVKVESIAGNPLKNLHIEGMQLRYEGKDFSFDVARVDTINIRYDIISFLKKRLSLEEVELINPHLWIKSDTAGVFILPIPEGGDAGGFPVINVERFRVESGQTIVQGDSTADIMQDLFFEGSIHTREKEITVSVEDGSGRNLGRMISLKRLQGRLRLVQESELVSGRAIEKPRLFVDDLAVVLDESSLLFGGMINLENMALHLKVEADPLEVEEIARIAAVETSHFGELQGTFIVKGVPDSLHVVGGVNGIFSGFAFSDFAVDLTWNGERLAIDSYEGDFNGAYVTGKGYYSSKEPEVLDIDAEVTGIDLSAGFVPRRVLPQTDFNGAVRVAYYIGEGNLTFSLDLDRGGHFRNFPFETAKIEGRYIGDSLFFDRILLDHPTHWASLRGWYTDDDELRLFVDLECTKEDTLFSYFDIEDYRADLQVNGIWEGTIDAWDIRTSGTAARLQYSEVLVPRGDIKLAIRKDIDYSVYFDMTGDSCLVGGREFYDPVFSLEYAAGITSIKRFHLSGGGIDLEAIFEVGGFEGSTVIRADDISIDALGENWSSGGEFTVSISDSAYTFKDCQLHSRLGAIYMDGSYRPGIERIDASFGFERLGIELLERAGLLPDLPIAGRAYGSVACIGDPDDPSVDVTMSMTGGTIDTIAIDTLKLGAHYGGGRYTIDSLSITSRESGGISIAGNLDGAGIRDLIREGSNALEGAVVNLDIACRDFMLAPILRPMELGPFCGGLLSGTVSISDSLVHPALVIDGIVRDLETKSLSLPVFEFGLTVDGKGIELNGTFDILEGKKGMFTGSFPLRNRRWFYSIDRQRPFSAHLTVPEGDFAWITDVTDFFVETEGRFAAGFMIGGTIEQPAIIGGVDLNDASFRLAGLEENFFDVQAEIKIEDTLVTVSSMTGREGKDGRFKCDGWMTLRGWRPSRYRMKVFVDEFLLASIPDLLSILSGELSIDSRMESGKAVPVLGGDLEVKQADVYYDLNELASREPSSTMAPPSWYAAVDLEVPGNTWIKTPDASIELQGRVTLHHDQRGMYLRGTLKLIRGWYNMYNNKFRIVSGTFDFVHAGGFRPIVDIEAETRDPEGRKIFLNLTWTQDDVEPRLVLTHEDPGYSETDIWKMLGGGVVGAGNGSGASWDALSTAQSIAANYLERLLNSQMEGMTIELEETGATDDSGGSLGEKETMIAVGKYLSEGLYVKFKQGLSITTARQIEVEYRISDLFLLRSEIIRHSEKTLQGKSRRSTDEINVDIKLRWEF